MKSAPPTLPHNHSKAKLHPDIQVIHSQHLSSILPYSMHRCSLIYLAWIDGRARIIIP